MNYSDGGPERVYLITCNILKRKILFAFFFFFYNRCIIYACRHSISARGFVSTEKAYIIVCIVFRVVFTPKSSLSPTELKRSSVAPQPLIGQIQFWMVNNVQKSVAENNISLRFDVQTIYFYFFILSIRPRYTRRVCCSDIILPWFIIQWVFFVDSNIIFARYLCYRIYLMVSGFCAKNGRKCIWIRTNVGRSVVRRILSNFSEPKFYIIYKTRRRSAWKERSERI